MKRFWVVFALVLTAVVGSPAGSQVGAADLPQVGTVLQELWLEAPSAAADREYLGIEGESFDLKEVKAEAVLVEILGVYCPRCAEQAPAFNKLFRRLQKNKALRTKLKMLGIAVGATVMEVHAVRDKGVYRYPVVKDEQFVVHKQLGEPRTPFTLLVDHQGRVLYTHLGVVKDLDAFYGELKQLVQ